MEWDGHGHAASAPAHAAVVSGVTHFNFFDFALMSPLYKRMGVLGELDGRVALDTNARVALAFFDAYLKNGGRPVWPDLPHVAFTDKPSSAGTP